MAEMEEETVKESIKELGKKFKQNPLDFTVETSLVAELQNIMSEECNRKKTSIEDAKFKDIEKEKYEEDYTDYKEKYLKRICNQD